MVAFVTARHAHTDLEDMSKCVHQARPGSQADGTLITVRTQEVYTRMQLHAHDKERAVRALYMSG